MSRYVTNAGGFYAYIAHGLAKACIVAALVALFSYSVLEIGLFGCSGSWLTRPSSTSGPSTCRGRSGHWSAWRGQLPRFPQHRCRGQGPGCATHAETAVLLVLAFAILFQGGADGIGFESFRPSNALTTGVGRCCRSRSQRSSARVNRHLPRRSQDPGADHRARDVSRGGFLGGHLHLHHVQHRVASR